MSDSPTQKKGPAIRLGNDMVDFDKVVQYRGAYAASPEAALPAASNQEAPAEADDRQKLLKKIDEYFTIVAETLGDNPEMQEEALQQLQTAKELVRRNEGVDPAWNISRAQFEVHRVHVAIAKEQQADREEGALRLIVPVIVLIYVAAVIVLITLGGRAWNSQTEIPIIGVPLSVVVWSVIGSVAAILYRFYTAERSRSAGEIRWLIARPVIGIIMGALSYLAVMSGLFIFSSAADTGATPSARPQLMYVVAFLGGFSDRFYEAIIGAVVGRFGSGQPEAQPPAAPQPEPETPEEAGPQPDASPR